MPNPAVQTGAAVSSGLRKYAYAFYLAPTGLGSAIAPLGPLGAFEPGNGWVRQGRLKDDDATWNVAAPTFLDGRAGFSQALQWRVVKQSEIPAMEFTLDEADPLVAAQLRGTAYSALSSGIYTGQQFIYKSGLFYAAKVLLIGVDVQGSGREHHVYAGKTTITFTPMTDPMFEGLKVTVSILDVSGTETFRENEWAGTF